MPVIGHLEGNCHVYVDQDAQLSMARAIVLNAKLRRTGICGAAETLLVDRACVGTHLAPLVKDLLEAGCEVRGDALVRQVDERVRNATEEDWYTEYLDSIIAVRVVNGVDEAHRPYRPLRLGTHGIHRDRQCRHRRTLPRAGRQRHCAAQRLHPIRRWR